MLLNSISLILTEDHIVREGVKSLFLRETGFSIVGESATGKGVVDLLNDGAKADIVIMDVTMPDTDCIKLTESIRKDFPEVKVIVLSNQINEAYIIKAFKAGINGYLMKNIPPEELIFAVRHVHSSSNYLCAQVMNKFMKRFTAIDEPVALKNDLMRNFSGREIEILTLISQGYPNHEIAEKLFTSKRTIENYRQGLIDKTGSRNIISLVRFAIINGLIS